MSNNTIVMVSTAWSVVEIVTARETRWMGTPENEIHGIYDAIEETGEFFDTVSGVTYVVRDEGGEA